MGKWVHYHKWNGSTSQQICTLWLIWHYRNDCRHCRLKQIFATVEVYCQTFTVRRRHSFDTWCRAKRWAKFHCLNRSVSKRCSKHEVNWCAKSITNWKWLERRIWATRWIAKRWRGRIFIPVRLWSILSVNRARRQLINKCKSKRAWCPIHY